MTEIGKASDQDLTEEAYARSIGKAGTSIPPSPGTIEDFNEFVYRRRRESNPRWPYGVVGDTYQYWDEWHQSYLDWEARWIRRSEWLDGYFEWRAKEMKATKAGNNGTQLGPREFTFTYGTHFEDDETAQRAMRQAVERLTRYYANEIYEFHAVGEFTRAGRSHVHGWYHLVGGKKITDKNFKRAYPIWNPKKKLGRGFEGGHHATIERVSDFYGYAEKHLEEAWLKVDINNGKPDEVNLASSPHSEDDYNL